MRLSLALVSIGLFCALTSQGVCGDLERTFAQAQYPTSNPPPIAEMDAQDEKAGRLLVLKCRANGSTSSVLAGHFYQSTAASEHTFKIYLLDRLVEDEHGNTYQAEIDNETISFKKNKSFAAKINRRDATYQERSEGSVNSDFYFTSATGTCENTTNKRQF